MTWEEPQWAQILIWPAKRLLVYTFLRPMIYVPSFYLLKDLMKIRNRGKFHQYSICSCLKIFKVLCTDSASMRWPLLEDFCGLTSPNMVQFCRNSRGSTLANKNIILNFFRVFREKGRIQSFHFGPILNPLLPLEDDENRKKLTSAKKNFSHWAIHICHNQGSISSPLSGKNAITFYIIWAIFGKTPGKGSESKFDISYFTHTNQVML